MVCIFVEHATDNLKGHIRRFLTEPSAGAFVGNVSAHIRNYLWGLIQTEDCDATMFFNTSNEQGWECLTQGKTKRYPINFDGIKLFEKDNNVLNLTDCLAKSDGTILSDHLYESGLIAKQLLINGRAAGVLDKIAEGLHTSKENAINIISFVTAMHDIGKMHPVWQLSWLSEDSLLYQKYVRLNLVETDEDNCQYLPFRHEVYSAQLLKAFLLQLGAEKRNIRQLFDILEFHHQGKNHQRDDYSIINSTVWNNLQQELINKLYDAFYFDVDFKVDKEVPLIQTLIGIINLSDWISSSEESHFTKRSNFLDDKSYFEVVSNEIIDFFKENDLIHNSFSSARAGINSVYEDVFRFNNITDTQKRVKEIIDSHDNIKYMLIEDVCGSGKTEAAFAAAVKFMEKYNKGGVYVGLPTSATSHAMYDRFEDFLSNINCLPLQGLSEFTSKAYLYQDDNNDAKIWTTPSRLKFLQSSAIGTVDQAMSSVQAYKYSCLRWIGLLDKVLIIDEIHAYDYYMMSIINSLLNWCMWANVPVIMLSATLPAITKENTYQETEVPFEKCSQAYPLISVVCEQDGERQLYEYKAKCQKTKYTKYKLLQWNESKIQAAADKALELVQRGGCVWLCFNTVRESVEAYDIISANFKGDVYLLNSVNTESQKTETINKIKYLFGEQGKKDGNRPQKAIVISTQMLEASANVDFDYLITDIAPIDILIQRIGRFHRHSDKGTIREQYPNNDYSVQILIPAGENYGSNQRIYNADVLTNTINELKKDSFIKEPVDIRRLIDNVYTESEEVIMQEFYLSSHASATLINEIDYDIFSEKERNTRYSQLNYVEVCLIEESEWDDVISNLQDKKTRYNQIIELQKNHVIKVPEYQLQGWGGENIECGIDNTIFIKTINNTFKNDIISICYDKTKGLQFEKPLVNDGWDGE